MSDGSYEGSAELFAILHSHSADLVVVARWLEPVLEFLGPNPFADVDDITDIDVARSIESPMTELGKIIETIRDQIGDDYRARMLTAEFAAALDDTQEFVSEYLSLGISDRARPLYVRTIVSRLQAVMPSKRKVKLANSLVVALHVAVEKILKIICYFDLRSALQRISELEYQTKSLREFFLHGKGTDEVTRPIAVGHLINLTIRDRGGYAYRRNIQIDFVKRVSARVSVRRGEMLRALGHLLNNAIKYNYQLRDNRVWVEIRTFREAGTVDIAFENWGSPITADELKSGVVFMLGRRGTFASARHVPGNGIGLADAKRIVEAHGGSIRVTSEPAQPQSSVRIDYSKPFITTVTVRLPVVP